MVWMWNGMYRGSGQMIFLAIYILNLDKSLHTIDYRNDLKKNSSGKGLDINTIHSCLGSSLCSDVDTLVDRG